MPHPADEVFVSAARATLDGLLQRRPDMATDLGDHRYDDTLAEGSASDHEEMIRWCGHRLDDLRAIDGTSLSTQNQIDLQILANRLELIRFLSGELREHEWNPMIANPGRAIYLLTARDFAPIAERLRCVARRLALVPGVLAAARAVLGSMPVAHIETALGQFAGTAHLIGAELGEIVASTPGAAAMERELAGPRAAALGAIEEHRRWLESRLAESRQDGTARDPRIGPELFTRKLRLTLDAQANAGEIVSRAEADLERVTEGIQETAARLAGKGPQAGKSADGGGGDAAARVRQVLGRLAAEAPDDTTILPLIRRAYQEQCDFVREHALVTTYDDPVEMIAMPEIERGVSVAYCDPPGPLETAPGATFVAVSPTPQEWTAEQVSSFYREYNRHMVHNLMIHEGVPGHVLQLQHSSRFRADAPVRAALRSGSFVEGWAVYAEQLMADRAYPGEGDPRSIRMQQLKMQLRMIINAILDARVHCEGMPEAAAMSLMSVRGYQEDAEAAGKWRRAVLTSTQLSTYYVGFTEVSDLAAELRDANPGLAPLQLHDMMLAHGSPAVRYLRTLLT